jgi:hypothetical protein
MKYFFTLSGNRFEIVLNNGQTWIAYTSSELTFAVDGSSLTATSALTGTLRY